MMISNDSHGPEPSDLDGGDLLARLREAEETLDAIRNGDVDAVVVGGPFGQKVYTLQNADRPYRVLIEQMQEGAFTLGEDGAILYCNERFASMVETEREGVVGLDVAAFFSDGEAVKFRELMAVSRPLKAAAEFSLRTRSHKELPVNISLVRLNVDEGSARVFSGVVTDLSLIRKRTDELAAANAMLASEIQERRRAQDSLQLALDAAGMGSWDLDLRANTTLRSLRHDQIFGYNEPVADWNLDTAITHFLAEDRAVVANAFDASLRTGALDFEARIRRRADGATRWVRFTGQTFYDGGEPVRIAGVVADVTDRRAVEDRTRHAQKIEALGQLTGGVAHDFNNLLMVVAGGLQMIDRQSDPVRRERILSGMRQAVERGTGLSRQLLAFSRNHALRPEPIDLARQIGAMQDLLDRSLRGDVQVHMELDEDLWPVEVDPGELQLVILNLALNARDAMPNGGTIRIRGRNVSAIADGVLAGDFVCLSVVDTGTGMPPEIVARVFEPFFTTKETGKGSGLGLAQAHGFAESSGGAIRIDSAPGVGTEVALWLPRTTKAPVAEVNPQPNLFADGRAAAASRGQVLIVEDNREVAALTIEMVEYLGFRTMRVAGAEAALGALQDGRVIDLVFSDVMMPGAMNGVDLAREIRKRRPELPVVLTSGYARAVEREAEAEGVQLLPKPFRLEDLASAFDAVRPKM
jgi:PAS domain S-box-containing protein